MSKEIRVSANMAKSFSEFRDLSATFADKAALIASAKFAGWIVDDEKSYKTGENFVHKGAPFKEEEKEPPATPKPSADKMWNNLTAVFKTLQPTLGVTYADAGAALDAIVTLVSTETAKIALLLCILLAPILKRDIFGEKLDSILSEFKEVPSILKDWNHSAATKMADLLYVSIMERELEHSATVRTFLNTYKTRTGGGPSKFDPAKISKEKVRDIV